MDFRSTLYSKQKQKHYDIAISVQPVGDGICDEPYTKVVRPVINMIVPSLSVFSNPINLLSLLDKALIL